MDNEQNRTLEDDIIRDEFPYKTIPGVFDFGQLNMEMAEKAERRLRERLQAKVSKLAPVPAEERDTK